MNKIKQEQEEKIKTEYRNGEFGDEGKEGCYCNKCGDTLICLHGKDEPHIRSLCGYCAN